MVEKKEIFSGWECMVARGVVDVVVDPVLFRGFLF